MSKVYVTKYALTTGIQVFEKHPTMNDNDDDDNGRVVCSSANGMNGWEMFHANDWHVSPEAAIDRAYKMRDLKTNSLHVQISKLNKKTFKESDFIVVPATKEG